MNFNDYVAALVAMGETRADAIQLATFKFAPKETKAAAVSFMEKSEADKAMNRIESDHLTEVAMLLTETLKKSAVWAKLGPDMGRAGVCSFVLSYTCEKGEFTATIAKNKRSSTPTDKGARTQSASGK